MGAQEIHSVLSVHSGKVMTADILSGAFQQYSLNSLRILQPVSHNSNSIELYQLPSNVCSRTTWTSTFNIDQRFMVRYANSILQSEVTVVLEDQVKVSVMMPFEDRLEMTCKRRSHFLLYEGYC